jgi:hypothetical protein
MYFSPLESIALAPTLNHSVAHRAARLVMLGRDGTIVVSVRLIWLLSFSKYSDGIKRGQGYLFINILYWNG